jgi:excisionase family DNA binding protein
MVEASSIFPYSLLCFAAINTMIDTMTDEILTLKEVAAYLKLAEKTAYKLAAEGKLPGFKVGGSWRFKRKDILAWIEEQKHTSQD